MINLLNLLNKSTEREEKIPSGKTNQSRKHFLIPRLILFTTTTAVVLKDHLGPHRWPQDEVWL